jgi:teichuronic acid biosynthesis glycosyltransferase TuaH
MQQNTPVDEKAFEAMDNKTILIFSNMRYDAPIEATAIFLARSFAATNPVYYIEYPLTYKDYINSRHSPAFLARKRSFLNADEAVIDTPQPNLKKISLPFVFPINFLPEGPVFRALLKINERIIVKRLKTILKKRGVKDFVFINSFNFHYPDVGKALKPQLNIYQCLDPMITPYDLKHGFVSELKLVKESDMVICTAKALYNEKSKINKNTFFVPNAADLTHSSKALDKNLPAHVLIKDITHPIIGYFGSIERRLDYDMLHKVIDANKDKNFVFAGPAIIEHIPEWIFNAPNVYLPGAVPYAEMPQMLKGFDIAIIPFKKDEVSNTIFPLKLFEYLGAGKPVIVTDFNPDLQDYTYGAVDFCADAASFSKAINDILKNDTAAKQGERLSVAQQNTWEIRASEIIVLMARALANEKQG